MKSIFALLIVMATSTASAGTISKGTSTVVQTDDSSLISIQIEGDSADKLMNAMSDDLIYYVDAKDTGVDVPKVVKKGPSITCSKYLGQSQYTQGNPTVWCVIGRMSAITGALVN